MDVQVGQKLKQYREQLGWSVRQLAEKSQVTAGMISCIERGSSSPSIATLAKILSALGLSLSEFFAEKQANAAGPVFRRETLKLVQDSDRLYRLVFGRRKKMPVEVLDEQILPRQDVENVESETFTCDIIGYILSGFLTLEVSGQAAQTLRPGDVFCVPRGQEHRGYAASGEAVRLVTVYYYRTKKFSS